MGWFFGKGGKIVKVHQSVRLSAAKKNKTVAKEVLRLTGEANRLRDAHDFLLAAEAYEQAAALAPWRIDLIVQSGNMYKDGGLLADAEDAYRKALCTSPDDADIHLQLGHALKLMGRRPAALVCYRKALALDPGCEGALNELVHTGIGSVQREQNDAFVRHGGVEAVFALTTDLASLRTKLDALEHRLPNIATWVAVPEGKYSLFRKLFDVPPVCHPAISAHGVTFVFSVDDVPLERLHGQLNALRCQSDGRWRAVFFGRSDAGSAAIKRITVADSRVRWMQIQEGETETSAERRASESAGGWLALLARGAVPHKRATEWFIHAARLTPSALISCDASIRATSLNSRGQLASDPTLIARWAFDSDVLLQRNIWGDTLLVASTLNTSLSSQVDEQATLAGRRSALLLAVGDVAHLPFALVDLMEDEDRVDRLDAHYAAVERAVSREGLICRVIHPAEAAAEFTPAKARKTFSLSAEMHLRLAWPLPPTRVPLTVILCTRNNAGDCKRMVHSLVAHAAAPDLLHCFVVDNGTDREEDKAILADLAMESHVTVRPQPAPFNWSHLNNSAAEECRDGLIVFANDDMEMLSAAWDDKLRAHLAAPEIGAVGAKLLYPDETIQHGGILFGWNESVIHDGLFLPAASGAQMGRWQMQRQVGAVTGAFFAIRKASFSEVGGFDASGLAISYSDVDLCLKLRRAGLIIRWDPELVLMHYESKSRGFDYLEPEKAARDLSEREVMYERWGREIFHHDPTVNPIWYDATLPFRLLRPVDDTSAIRQLSGSKNLSIQV
ncbi:tetratricopeptide repeat protein [Nguyenibacter vanlangensis]|uniref:Tetratricopeptide repeat protein n=1 Tax=Nguyenibacter vanlangensis TaxID=1216886 RepID=A0ABZ3D7T1_9PROT